MSKEIMVLGGLAARKGGGFQTGYSVYGAEGICPTVLSHSGGYGIMTAKVKVIGQMDNSIDHTFESANRVYDKAGLCPALPTCAGGGIQPKVIDVKCGAVRGRGDGWKQTLEIKDDGTTNTLTGVQKDNVVMEGTETRYRIRKLTPRECWRLMNFKDTDFDKASKAVSNSQLYKQAGNAIVKQVLMAIFLQMNIQGIKNWNDRTISERENLAGGAEWKKMNCLK